MKTKARIDKAQPSIESLVSTMNEHVGFIYKFNFVTDALIINQSLNNEEYEITTKDGLSIRVVNSLDVGLSKSRNLALQKSTSDIVMLADNDIKYLPNAKKTVESALAILPEADVIIFKIKGLKKKYWNRIKRLGFFTARNISSVQICMNRKAILDHGIMFNEKFGAGARYRSGEENLFIKECLTKKLKIYFVPEYIAILTDDSESTWFKGFSKKYLFDKGVFAAVCYPRTGRLIIFYYLLKFSLTKKVKFYKALRSLLLGFKRGKTLS